MFEAALLTLVGAAAITGAAYDLTTLTIPNWISLFLLALFPVLALAAGLSLSDAGVHFAIGAAALALGIVLFAGGIIGGGDAKLFAALALYMGAQSIVSYVFAVAFAGGLLAVVLVVLRLMPVRLLLSQLPLTHKLGVPGVSVPYGVAIATGALFAFPATQIFALATIAGH
ncbi:MAG: prepilin peptidase [Micropepsaceae bacterium]